MNIISTLKENYIFAVIRGNTQEDGYKIAEACVAGGINNLEITFSTPNANQLIEELKNKYKNNASIVVGAGTVMDLELAKDAYEAGAEFLVSPHFSLDIAEYAQKIDVPYIPGAATVTEIITAEKAGAEIVKVFPGSILGPKFISDVRGPIPEVQLMPSGGVSLDNIKDWKDNGAVAVGIGGALTKEVSAKGYDSVSDIAQSFIEHLV